MQITIIIVLSFICLLLTGLLAFLFYFWQKMQQQLRDKESVIDQKHAEIKRHTAELNRKEIIIREEIAKRREISVSYFTEVTQKHGFFHGSDHIKYKMQLFVDGIPVAQSFIIKEDRFSATNLDHVNKILDEFAKPLVDMGVRVVVNYLGASAKKELIKSLSSLSGRTMEKLRKQGGRAVIKDKQDAE